MAFIGNTVQTQGFAPAIDYFNGNGSTVTFTLSRPVASVAQMIVAVANVIQNPASAYTVSGNAITFTSAPPSGTNNIWVEYTSLITTYAAISQSHLLLVISLLLVDTFLQAVLITHFLTEPSLIM